MKTIANGNGWHLWISRNPWTWFELWGNWDCHNYLLSITILTIEIGWEWVWVKSRPNIEKGGKQLVWFRNI